MHFLHIGKEGMSKVVYFKEEVCQSLWNAPENMVDN
jgi:hypothetical protein